MRATGAATGQASDSTGRSGSAASSRTRASVTRRKACLIDQLGLPVQAPIAEQTLGALDRHYVANAHGYQINGLRRAPRKFNAMRVGGSPESDRFRVGTRLPGLTKTFNTLKNQGYHFEHSFGHGKQYLSTALMHLMMLALLMDRIQQRCCRLFQAALTAVKSKTRLWRKLRNRFDLCLIPSWEVLFRSIIEPPRLPLPHDTS